MKQLHLDISNYHFLAVETSESLRCWRHDAHIIPICVSVVGSIFDNAAGKVTVGKRAIANVPQRGSALFNEGIMQNHKHAIHSERNIIIWLGISMIENVSAISIASEFISFLWWLLTKSNAQSIL